MVNSQATFLGQFFYISVAEGVAAVPGHTAQDDRREIMTPFEQTQLRHEAESLQTQASYPTMNSVFATKPCIPSQPLRADDFEAFYLQRKQALLSLIERAMGKQILREELESEDSD